MVRVGKGGGSAPAAAAPERVRHPASQFVARAARGEAEALFRLGVCYYRGEGVPQSYERASELCKQAAAKGHAGAQYNLGALYYYGQGVPKDVARGVVLFKQAAAGGIKEAADFLRTLGEAVPPAAPGAAGAPQPMD
jgi:TPR repeat protein